VIGSNGGGDTASVNVDEGATAVTTVTATDPDVPAQTLSFSVLTGAGSPDGGKFSIDGSGNLTFIAPPNFEAFGSAASNNTYVVQVRVTDNGQGRAEHLLGRLQQARQGCADGYHRGLSNIDERVRHVDGRLSISDAPGGGVRLEVRVPTPAVP